MRIRKAAQPELKKYPTPSLVLKRNRSALAAGVGALLAAATAVAQPPYPFKPIRVIVPIAAGSATDAVMRAASQELSARLGQPLVIDNRTGASGIIGAEACAKATPDGYTIWA